MDMFPSAVPAMPGPRFSQSRAPCAQTYLAAEPRLRIQFPRSAKIPSRHPGSSGGFMPDLSSAALGMTCLICMFRIVRYKREAFYIFSLFRYHRDTGGDGQDSARHPRQKRSDQALIHGSMRPACPLVRRNQPRQDFSFRYGRHGSGASPLRNERQNWYYQ